MLWDSAETVSAVASHTMAYLSSVPHIAMPVAWVIVPVIVSRLGTNDMTSKSLNFTETPSTVALIRVCVGWVFIDGKMGHGYKDCTNNIYRNHENKFPSP